MITNIQKSLENAIDLSSNHQSDLVGLSYGDANSKNWWNNQQEPANYFLPTSIVNNETGQVVKEYAGWPGMSSPKGRCLFNNICKELSMIQDVKYLEVGTWAGSTLLSFMLQRHQDKNFKYASAVDNFTQFQTDFDVRQMLVNGLGLALGHNNLKITEDNYEINYKDDGFKFQFLESHCFELDKSRLFGKYNVYFFDGPHARQDTKDGFVYYNDVLEDTFVVIIDDWCRDYVQQGWWDAVKELNYDIKWDREIIGKGGKGEDRQEIDPNWRGDWWDGYYIGIVSKNQESKNER